MPGSQNRIWPVIIEFTLESELQPYMNYLYFRQWNSVSHPHIEQNFGFNATPPSIMEIYLFIPNCNKMQIDKFIYHFILFFVDLFAINGSNSFTFSDHSYMFWDNNIGSFWLPRIELLFEKNVKYKVKS